MATKPIGRQTRVKELVTQVLRTNPEPLSLRDIFHYVKITFPTTAYSTVFRITNKLEQDGKVVRIDWRERGSRYEWAELPHHHHIICQICGTLVDLEDEDLNFDTEKIKDKTGFVVKYHSIELEGICAKCQKGGK